MKKLKKIACITDIHFGKRNNSETHNKDCIRFLEWFCDKVRNDPEIDSIAFLGDWNENRSALNISTLNYSYKGAKLLNDLNLPVYFIIGNHDLYHRHTREVHSVIPFNEFTNFVLIEEPTVIKDFVDDTLFCPFMFHNEYPSLVKYNKLKIWFGHFEFKGFEVTGYGMKMPTGPEAKDFKGPKYIISGHFHKRQVDNNIIYMGNVMPMDFGDAGDNERGCMVYDYKKDEMEFYNWEDCPKYIKTHLSDLIEGNQAIPHHARVKCIIDIPIDFEESNKLRQSFIDTFELREFSMEESFTINEALTETDTTIDWENEDIKSVDELVEYMLKEIKSDYIQNEQLISIYRELTTQQ